jgi:hypothetical protein
MQSIRLVSLVELVRLARYVTYHRSEESRESRVLNQSDEDDEEDASMIIFGAAMSFPSHREFPSSFSFLSLLFAYLDIRFHYLFTSHRVQTDANSRFIDATNSFFLKISEEEREFLISIRIRDGKWKVFIKALDLLQFILDLLLPSWYVPAWASWFFRSRNVSAISCSSRNKVRAISNSRKPTARTQKMRLNTQREAGI